jgi:hypothetical protein
VVGDTIQWTYLVTNPGDVPLMNVVVVDDNGTAGDTADDFNPDPILDGGFNIGDVNQDGKLDVGEEWRYQAEGIAGFGQYANESDVEGTSPAGTKVTDDDPSHYIASFPTGDLCETYSKPTLLTFQLFDPNATAYVPNGEFQDSGKVEIIGTVGGLPATVTHEKGKFTVLSGSPVSLDGVFVLQGTDNDNKFDNETVFWVGGQSIELHTSCSQPIQLGDKFGSVQLIGFEGIPR